MLQDRFVRGYVLAIAMILLFAAALSLGNLLGDELEEAQRKTPLYALRALHQKDQKEAGSEHQ